MPSFTTNQFIQQQSTCLLHPQKSNGSPPPLLGDLDVYVAHGLSLPHSYLLNHTTCFVPVCLASQPFLALSSDELSKTIPLLRDVPVSTLKVALPLLAKQDISVIRKMIKFLKLVSPQPLGPQTPCWVSQQTLP